MLNKIEIGSCSRVKLQGPDRGGIDGGDGGDLGPSTGNHTHHSHHRLCVVDVVRDLGPCHPSPPPHLCDDDGGDACAYHHHHHHHGHDLRRLHHGVVVLSPKVSIHMKRCIYILAAQLTSQNLRRRRVCLDFLLAKDTQDNNKVIPDFEPLLANSQGFRVDHLAADLGPFCAWRCFSCLFVLLVRCNTLTDGVWLLREADLGLFQDALERLFVLLLAGR